MLAQSAAMIGGYTLSGAGADAGELDRPPAACRRSGEVPVRPGSPEGTAVTVWTDASGYLVSPPLPSVRGRRARPTRPRSAAVVGLVVGYVASAAAIRQLLNRRRMAAWEADWLATAPAWNRQRW